MRCTTLLLSIGLILATDVFAAERIWDSDLKRYLTEQEMSMAEVFLTEEEAVKLMFPKSEHIKKDLLRVPTDRKAAIEDRIGWKFPEDVFEVYIGETGTQVDGYALLQNTIGKHKPMTYMVGVDNRGRVSNIELLVFREARGSEVRRKRFNAQYEGKTVLDPIRINKDIINISGATMSVRSISAGIKRALALVDEFYLKPAGFGSDTMALKKSEQGIFGSIFGN
ncbi:MAG: FMN-binding protein [Nitrospirota bacterium]|nr:FMN-binding protein [Nitrospirota bacterium]